jgi:3-oxoacyl-[acyl-carrier-protein] synthase II
MGTDAREVWITGLGLISSLGEGADAHWECLSSPEAAKPVVDEKRFTPYPVHPLGPVDFSRFVPKRSDQNQMGQWQLTGVAAAGLALEDAGIAGNDELLDATNLIIAAGNGERDIEADRKILDGLADADASSAEPYLNETLPRSIRPTRYLVELSNLLAGNISIVHGATGSSRTYKGEEAAGVSAVEDAFRRVRSGQTDICLVGGAYNAEREDQLLIFEIGKQLWRGAHKPVWARHGEGGGMVIGSLGAFLVIEAREHAEARGVRGYARITGAASGRSDRVTGSEASNLRALFDGLDVKLPFSELPVMSGASGVEPALAAELAFLRSLHSDGYYPLIRAFGSVLGHGVEAHFPMGVALAALAVARGKFYPPFDATREEDVALKSIARVLVTGIGHWRGEGLALIEAVEQPRKQAASQSGVDDGQ